MVPCVALVLFAGCGDSRSAFDQAMEAGHAAMMNEDYPSAVDAYTSALEIDADSRDALVHRGWAYTYLKQFDVALADYERAEQLSPDSELLMERRAELFEAMGRKQDAARERRRISAQ